MIYTTSHFTLQLTLHHQQPGLENLFSVLVKQDSPDNQIHRECS